MRKKATTDVDICIACFTVWLGGWLPFDLLVFAFHFLFTAWEARKMETSSHVAIKTSSTCVSVSVCVCCTEPTQSCVTDWELRGSNSDCSRASRTSVCKSYSIFCLLLASTTQPTAACHLPHATSSYALPFCCASLKPCCSCCTYIWLHLPYTTWTFACFFYFFSRRGLESALFAKNCWPSFTLAKTFAT